jgi:hypothetical protein
LGKIPKFYRFFILTASLSIYDSLHFMKQEGGSDIIYILFTFPQIIFQIM